MPPLLTLSELRGRIETGLGDDALAGVLAAADAMIIDRHGAHPGVSEVYPLLLTDPWTVALPRRATSVSDVQDYYALGSPMRVRTDVSIGAGGWEIWAGEDGRFRRYVSLRLTPHDDTALRREVTANVVQAMLNFQPGIQSDRIGEYNRTNATYATALMAAMHPLDRLVVR